MFLCCLFFLSFLFVSYNCIEEFLEKVIEKLPYIGEEYKKEKEEQERAKESLDGVEGNQIPNMNVYIK